MDSLLYQRSLEILIKNQSPSGAFIASPTFPTYRYAWFRDGSFCAHALDLAGERVPARRFHHWAAGVVMAHLDKLQTCVSATGKGRSLNQADFFHARFSLDGGEVPGHWGYHQLDGSGAWLWALGQHLLLNAETGIPSEWRQAARALGEYLAALWQHPCSDLWEENEDQMHTYTLAAVYAGLNTLADVLGESWAGAEAEKVKAFILSKCAEEGRLVKSLGNPEVDASLLALSVPFQVLSPGDPVMQATVEEIDRSLGSPAGGYRRYSQDSYYGGGEWILLSAWRGWLACSAGDCLKAASIRTWIETQADDDGFLPEQVPDHLNHPAFYPQWVQRWGPLARPLLWSHAMYLILSHAIRNS